MPYKNNNYQLLLFTKRFLFLHPQWVVSSVGLEHYLDRVGVTGSNPVQPTKAVRNDRLFLQQYYFNAVIIALSISFISNGFLKYFKISFESRAS